MIKPLFVKKFQLITFKDPDFDGRKTRECIWIRNDGATEMVHLSFISLHINCSDTSPIYRPFILDKGISYILLDSPLNFRGSDRGYLTPPPVFMVFFR